MEHYAGLDVSLEQTSVCVVDARGQVVREAKVASEPEALVHFLAREDLEIARVGLEAGPLSQWLHAGLIAAGYEAVLLETRHPPSPPIYSLPTALPTPRQAPPPGQPVQPGPLTKRPGVAPVGSPPLSTWTPLTNTSRTPVANCIGFSNVA